MDYFWYAFFGGMLPAIPYIMWCAFTGRRLLDAEIKETPVLFWLFAWHCVLPLLVATALIVASVYGPAWWFPKRAGVLWRNWRLARLRAAVERARPQLPRAIVR